jgi:hypothetical protein
VARRVAAAPPELVAALPASLPGAAEPESPPERWPRRHACGLRGPAPAPEAVLAQSDQRAGRDRDRRQQAEEEPASRFSRAGEDPPDDDRDAQQAEHGGAGATRQRHVQLLTRHREQGQRRPCERAQGHDEAAEVETEAIPAAHAAVEVLDPSAEPIEEQEHEQGDAANPGDDLARSKP